MAFQRVISGPILTQGKHPKMACNNTAISAPAYTLFDQCWASQFLKNQMDTK